MTFTVIAEIPITFSKSCFFCKLLKNIKMHWILHCWRQILQVKAIKCEFDDTQCTGPTLKRLFRV